MKSKGVTNLSEKSAKVISSPATAVSDEIDRPGSTNLTWRKAEQWSQPERTRRLAGEALGTFAIVLAAGGSSIANSLSNGGVGLVGAALASGLAVMAMIYALGHICNAHFNPAVTLAFCLTRHFPLKEVPGYVLAQIGGAVVAAATLKITFGDIANLGATIPAAKIGAGPALVIEIILSFFLMFVIVAVATDTRAVGQAAAIAIGVTVIFDILIGGPVSGASMNPARSFGPALLSGQWQDHWLYWLGPGLGASLGAVTYQFLRGEKETHND